MDEHVPVTHLELETETRTKKEDKVRRDKIVKTDESKKVKLLGTEWGTTQSKHQKTVNQGIKMIGNKPKQKEDIGKNHAHPFSVDLTPSTFCVHVHQKHFESV